MESRLTIHPQFMIIWRPT